VSPARPRPRAASRRAARVERRATRRRRVRLDIDERRRQLLELGKRAFAERAYDDVSIDDIARAAGISKGLLYHYFPTKRDLYVAGLREIAADLVAKTNTIPSDLPPIDRVRAGLDAYLDHVGKQASAYIALMRGGIGSDPEVIAVIEGTRGQLIDQILDRAGGTPIAAGAGQLFRLAVRGWIGFVEAVTIEWLADHHGGSAPVGDRDVIRDYLVEMLLASLRIPLLRK
jgi:AcrR family transcriptional regulator